MKNKNNEINELIEQLSLPPQQAREIIRDIQQGDQLLNQASHPEPPEHLIRRIEQSLPQQHPRTVWLKTVRRIAAVLMIGLTLALVSQWEKIHSPDSSSNQSNIPATRSDTDIFDDELNIWDLALIQQAQEQNVDDMLYSEILILWEDLNGEADNISKINPSTENPQQYLKTASVMRTMPTERIVVSGKNEFLQAT